MNDKIKIMDIDRIQLFDSFFQPAKICESILRSLPQWFGNEKALVQYIEETQSLPTLFALVENEYVGFLSFKQHNRYSAELYVMGVRYEYQRQGIGSALIHHTESILRQQKLEYWQVKTLAASHPDRFYARTRAFYFAMGFRPLEVLTQLWGEDNPCLLMVKYLQFTDK
ncbi:MAG: GNAT family N-acetyltransferase [Xenococcaceae cyanobacterium MO_188.B29]|nr:GNAT family N-acetyltransferase [Xenococcaceae cyanobacterium MO_188.B29]